MKLDSICRDAMQAYLSAKSVVCWENHGPASLPPMVQATFPNTDKVEYAVVEGDPGANVEYALDEVAASGFPEHVYFLFDAYMGGSEPGACIRGQLSEDFRDNPQSEVREFIGVIGVNTLTGNRRMIVVPYTYDDEGLPAFEEDAEDSCDFGGRVLEGLLRWCTRRQEARKKDGVGTSGV